MDIQFKNENISSFLIKSNSKVFFNSKLIEMLNISDYDIRGLDFDEFLMFITEDYKQEFREKLFKPIILKSFIAEIQPYKSEKKNFMVIPQYVKIEKSYSLTGLLIDISDIYKNNVRLSVKASILENLLFNTSEFIIILDEKRDIFHVSKKLREILLLTKENLNLNDFIMALSPELRQIWKGLFFEIQQFKRFTKQIDFSDSSVNLIIDFDIFRVNDKEHNSEIVYLIGRDITGEKFEKSRLKNEILRTIVEKSKSEEKLSTELKLKEKISQSLDTANRKANEGGRVKNEFLLNMSHELQTPLNAINGFSEILYSELKDSISEMHLDFFKEIIVNGHFLENMIKKILHLSKIESDTLTMNYSVFFLSVFMKKIVENISFDKDYKNQRIELILNIKNDEVDLDYEKLKQIVIQILKNAFKFSKKDSLIEIHVESNDVLLKISIKDQGIGISKVYHEKIFDKFYQIENVDTKEHQGIGIGLFLSKKLVEYMNGKIEVESSQNLGSKFSFTIPLERIVKKKKHITVHLLGLEGAGKTSILFSLLAKSIPNTYFPTEKLQHYNYEYLNVDLVYCDVPGNMKSRILWDKAIDSMQFLIFVIDISDSSKYKEINIEFRHIIRNKKVEYIPKILLFHKYDLLHSGFQIEEMKKIIFPDIKFKAIKNIYMLKTTIKVVETIKKLENMIFSIIKNT